MQDDEKDEDMLRSSHVVVAYHGVSHFAGPTERRAEGQFGMHFLQHLSRHTQHYNIRTYRLILVMAVERRLQLRG
jgi:hypothetical protein